MNTHFIENTQKFYELAKKGAKSGDRRASMAADWYARVLDDLKIIVVSKPQKHALAPFHARLANCLFDEVLSGESYFYAEEVKQAELFLLTFFETITKVETCGLVRISARDLKTKYQVRLS